MKAAYRYAHVLIALAALLSMLTVFGSGCIVGRESDSSEERIGVAEQAISTMTPDEIIERAKPAMGYSYWWAHGAWRLDDAQHGSCSGGCPSCSHSGSYGADCSGLVAKVWQVPGDIDVTDDAHPYSTYNFRYESTHWSQISRSDVQKGDAFVYHADGAGHTFLYESGDPWGSMWAYECKGCGEGCVHDLRTAGSSYVAIRREALGNPRTATQGNVAAWSPARLDVFYRGTDDGLWHTSWGGEWGNDQVGSNITSRPAVASWGPNRLDVFARTTESKLLHAYWDGTAWGSDTLDVAITSDPAAVSWGPNRIDVFARGTDDALVHVAWDGSHWTDAESLGGKLTTRPAVASWEPNRLDVFAGAADGTIYHQYWNGGWGSDSVPVKITSAPSVVAWGPNRLDVFARAADKTIAHVSWDPDGWGTDFLDGDISSDPVALSWAPGRLDVFARSVDSAVWHAFWDGSGWGTDSIGGALTSDPWGVSWGPGRIDVFGRGADAALVHQAWDGTWEGWESIGGKITCEGDPAAAIDYCPPEASSGSGPGSGPSPSGGSPGGHVGVSPDDADAGELQSSCSTSRGAGGHGIAAIACVMALLAAATRRPSPRAGPRSRSTARPAARRS